MGFIKMPLFQPALHYDAILSLGCVFTHLKLKSLSERKFDRVMCMFETGMENPYARTQSMTFTGNACVA